MPTNNARIRRKALASREASGTHPHLDTELEELCRRADPAELARAAHLESAFLDEIMQNASTPNTLNSIFKLIMYYENTGAQQKCIQVGDILLKLAKNRCDIALERRVRNALSVCNIRLLDFESACQNLERSCHLAKRIGDPLALIATLSNAAVLLNVMGLDHAAVDLGLTIADKPAQGVLGETVKLINANNGMRAAHAIGDKDSASRFFSDAQVGIRRTAGCLSSITQAYYDAAVSEHMIALGEPKKALALIDQAIVKGNKSNNARVHALLQSTRASVIVALHATRSMEPSIERLRALLPRLDNAPSQKEDVLRSLVRILQASSSTDAKREASKARRQLREFVLSTKHRLFFLNVSHRLRADTSVVEKMQMPGSSVPPWLAVEKSQTSGLSAILPSHCSEEFFDFGLPPYSGTVESRCSFYDIAENWAVATECAGGSSGDRCFRVGMLSRSLALRLGFAEPHCLLIEKACRLRDIGSVTANFYRGRDEIALNEYGAIREHTKLGARLLDNDESPVIRLASIVAKNHHEWWNGCGGPSGLCGESIPVEARICSVADTFLTLLEPMTGKVAWTVTSALRQTQSMANVQLDPKIVVALTALLESGVFDGTGVSKADVEARNNSLILSRAKLFDVLEMHYS